MSGGPRQIETPGSWPVGLQIFELWANARRIQAYAWHPACQNSEAPRTYMTMMEAHAHALAAQSIGAAAPNSALLTTLKTRSVPNAPMATGSFPLVVFNHGGGLSPLANFSLMEALASSGMVAVSVGHAGDSLALVWQDGSVSQIAPQTLARMQLPPEAMAAFARFVLDDSEEERRRALAVFQGLDPGGLRALSRAWADDSIALVDHLLDSQAAGHLCRAIDRARLAYGGMSLGASAAFDSCRRDRRAVAGFNLDGVNWDFSAIDRDIGIPFLGLQSDPENQRSQLAAFAPDLAAKARRIGNANDFHYVAPNRHSISPDIIRLGVIGADHMDFTDNVVLERLSAGEPSEAAGAMRSAIVQVTCLFLQWVFGMAERAELDAAIADSSLFTPAGLKG